MTTSEKTSKSTLWIILLVAVIVVAYLGIHHKKPLSSAPSNTESSALTQKAAITHHTATNAISHEKVDTQ